MKKVFLLFMVVWSLNLQADEQSRFQSANEAYSKKDYDTAIQGYESLIQNGIDNYQVYYNLGNCYYRKKNWGPAVLYYERALLRNPSDADTRKNLEILRSKLKGDLEALPSFFLNRWWTALSQLLSSTLWSFVFLVLLWLGAGGLILWLLAKKRRDKKTGFFAALILWCIAACAVLLGINQAQLEGDSGRGVVMEETTNLFGAPDLDSKQQAMLYEGTTFYMMDKIGEWYKIKLINGEQGWVPASAIEKI